MLSKEHQRAFEEFIEAMHGEAGLDRATLCLVSLGAALALGCPVCIDRFIALARSEGVSQSQIGAVAAATMAVAAGNVRNRILEASTRQD